MLVPLQLRSYVVLPGGSCSWVVVVGGGGGGGGGGGSIKVISD
jgi:hypothetical protein